MTDEKSNDPLLEWNRLNKNNAEHGFVSAIFQSMAETSPLIDKFSTWLLAGTGATAALLITQIKSILPYLTEKGFKVCLVVLVISAVAGFVAKYHSLRCDIQNKMQSKLMELLEPVLEKHEEDEDKILEYAQQQGIELQTDIDFSNVINEFSKPFPFWVKWLIARKIKKTSNDRQAGYHIAIKAYVSQGKVGFFSSNLIFNIYT